MTQAIANAVSTFGIREADGKVYVAWPDGNEREFSTLSDANNAIEQRKNQARSVEICSNLVRFLSAPAKTLLPHQRVAKAMLAATIKGISSEMDKDSRTNANITKQIADGGADLASKGAEELGRLFTDLGELFGLPDMNVKGVEYSLHKATQLVLLGSVNARQSGKMDASEGIDAIAAYRNFVDKK